MDEDDDLGLSEEFLADECIAREEDNYGDRRPRCTCGYLRSLEAMKYDGYARAADFQDLHDQYEGCKGCDPIDQENKPHGWGVERFEDPALDEANRYAIRETLRSYGAYSLACGKVWSNRLLRDQRWAACSSHDNELERLSDRVWDALCDCCQTHKEAIRRYGKWCERRGLKKLKGAK